MKKLVEQLKINPNQNLLGLVVSFGALGVAEYYELCVLFWLSIIISIVMVISVAVTTCFYTIDYCDKKSAPKP
jgi:hypothetical protein